MWFTRATNTVLKAAVFVHAVEDYKHRKQRKKKSKSSASSHLQSNTSYGCRNQEEDKKVPHFKDTSKDVCGTFDSG